ncbi:15889_t:CDS:2 [Acaulospora morrowiae]|uniref:15889_t:CDS:1 n=1 Tax=Acaulospora morrowiae TaxID=94023 RepID=A0A9N8Z4B6_9GLOM|nr:15889_t:CDS:2 [Acaulospora morrowiae]
MEYDEPIHLQPIRNTPSTVENSVLYSSPSDGSSHITINLARNESAYTIERSPNVVQNFLSEIDPKSPISLTWQNANLMGKDHFNLNLPLLVSAMHTGMHFLITLVLMKGYLPSFYKKSEEKPVSSDSYLSRVVPCALTAAFEICMANASLVFITLSFYTMVKSSTPIWVLMFAFIFRLEQPRVILVFIIFVISTGVVMTVFGETQFNLIGFLLVLGASVVSGLRWSLTQILLQKESSMNDPVATLYYISPVMFSTMSILSLLLENPYHVFTTSEHFKDFETSISTFALMMSGGLLAFFMTLSEFALIKNTSTVTLSVAGISKEIVMITLSVLIYHDKLTSLNVLGLFVSISGIAGYNYYKVMKSNNVIDKKGRYQVLSIHKNEQLD